MYAANSCKSLSLILLITSAATAAAAAAARFAGVAALLLLLLAVVITVAACMHIILNVHALCELVSVTASSWAIAAVLKLALSASHIHVKLHTIFNKCEMNKHSMSYSCAVLYSVHATIAFPRIQTTII
jgi:hypothetical protein